jgi:excinuclease ABC subunit B
MSREQRSFEVVSPFSPTGDQPSAIEQLSRDLIGGAPCVTLLGATGTGKTFTMAHTIQRFQRPTLIISHNKTLAAQLYEEMRELFPHNSVNYFVSYYDYYQPEAYIPQRDIYIEKDSSRNPELEALRLGATSNILSRRDTIVVASVSCIFGLGSPQAYSKRVLAIARGARVDRREFLLAMNAMQYKRADMEFQRGMYRVRGEVIEVWPAYEKFAVRVELFGDEIERIEYIDPLTGELLGGPEAQEKQYFLFPAVHYVTEDGTIEAILVKIREELDTRVMELRAEGKLLEAQRLLARTKYDMEMIQEVGYCSGIENYSRFFDGRQPGERPYTLMDYFDFAPRGEALGTGHQALAEQCGRPNFRDWLCIIDESHVTMPQIHAMFNGDRNRKRVLVDHGFRLPSAMDNRPLTFAEFESIAPRLMFVSATPGKYELEKCHGVVAEQVIRPTGLVDPIIEVRPAQGQVADLVGRCKERASRGERVLVTALTKRLCEDLTTYLDEQGVRVRYLHSEIETLERMEILAELREGAYDVLVGVNLLREGLDLPEVSLVCILDADKEGFLRSETSLIQQMGRAARNSGSLVVMYADKMTPSMDAAIRETERRRVKQLAYNAEHGITPTTIVKGIRRGLEAELKARRTAQAAVAGGDQDYEVGELIMMLEEEMLEAAQNLDFEKAARLRDQAKKLKGGAGKKPRVRRSELEGSGSGREGGGERRAGMPGVRANKKSKKWKRGGD